MDVYFFCSSIFLTFLCAAFLFHQRFQSIWHQVRFPSLVGFSAFLLILVQEFVYQCNLTEIRYIKPMALKGALAFMLIGLSLWAMNHGQKKIPSIVIKLGVIGYLTGLLEGWDYPVLFSLGAVIAYKILKLKNHNFSLFETKVLNLLILGLLWDFSLWQELRMLHFMITLLMLSFYFQLFELLIIRQYLRVHEKDN